MKERFLKIYANLPIPLRSEVIYVDKEYGACSWNVVLLEVKADTEIGKTALKQLEKMKII